MAYKVCLSNKSEIQIDRDELPVVKSGIESGARLIKVRSGMFNPAFIVSIEPDLKRLEGMDALDELPDLFDRIGKMKSMAELLEEKKLALNEPEISPEKKREMLNKHKPDFLKNIGK